MKKTIEARQGSHNVYADLGCPDADAMKRKARIVSAIADAIEVNDCALERAANIADLSRRTLTSALRGHFHGISEMKLTECLGAMSKAKP